MTPTESNTIEVDDNHSGSATQAVTVTITGTNENPVITAPTTCPVTEDLGADRSNILITDPTATVTYTLSLHDALPISSPVGSGYLGTFTPSIAQDTVGGTGGSVA